MAKIRGLFVAPAGQGVSFRDNSELARMAFETTGGELVEIATLVECAEPGNLGNFTPGLDIRSMQHERLYSRLFVS